MARAEADKRFENTLRSLGYAVLRIQRANGQQDDGGVRLTELRFKLDADNRTSVLVVLKGAGADGDLVAFVGSPDLETAVYSVGKAIKAGTLRWREDRPFPR